MAKTRQETRKRRQLHIRKRVYGTSGVPRINVFRSNKHLYVQAIDDESTKSMMGMSSVKLTKKKDEKPVDKANRLGTEFGKKLKAKKITTAVFDRAGYKFHGEVKALVEGMRKSGIKL